LAALSRRSDVTGAFLAMLHPALGCFAPLVTVQDRRHIAVSPVREQRYNGAGLKFRVFLVGKTASIYSSRAI